MTYFLAAARSPTTPLSRRHASTKAAKATFGHDLLSGSGEKPHRPALICQLTPLGPAGYQRATSSPDTQCRDLVNGFNDDKKSLEILSKSTLHGMGNSSTGLIRAGLLDKTLPTATTIPISKTDTNVTTTQAHVALNMRTASLGYVGSADIRILLHKAIISQTACCYGLQAPPFSSKWSGMPLSLDRAVQHNSTTEEKGRRKGAPQNRATQEKGTHVEKSCRCTADQPWKCKSRKTFNHLSIMQAHLQFAITDDIQSQTVCSRLDFGMQHLYLAPPHICLLRKSLIKHKMFQRLKTRSLKGTDAVQHPLPYSHRCRCCDTPEAASVAPAGSTRTQDGPSRHAVFVLNRLGSNWQLHLVSIVRDVSIIRSAFSQAAVMQNLLRARRVHLDVTPPISAFFMLISVTNFWTRSYKAQQFQSQPRERSDIPAACRSCARGAPFTGHPERRDPVPEPSHRCSSKARDREFREGSLRSSSREETGNLSASHQAYFSEENKLTDLVSVQFKNHSTSELLAGHQHHFVIMECHTKNIAITG
ncbi:hypothetical protein Anapl_16548 [Anas platyrhynchos]|uniref:Uncharacterized protein n=1 Tax=Anas platyrhynchos TaxID=8839 RepID=R0JBZ1_ANAPL|nr:hypothetical protein Anapl_16548 [Anas platyrhynchos]